MGLKKFDKAINILRSLLKTYDDVEKKIHTNMYLMMTYLEMNEVEKVKYYFRKNRKLIDSFGCKLLEDDLLMHYFELGKTGLFLKRNELSFNYVKFIFPSPLLLYRLRQ